MAGLPLTSFDRGVSFLRAHKLAFAAGGAGLAGAAWGARQGYANPNDDGKWQTAAQRAIGVGITGAAIGGAAFAGRRLMARTAWGSYAGGMRAYAGSWGKAFSEKTWGGVLRHPAVTATVGGAIGGLIASRFSDDPSTIATGVGAGVAAGVFGLPMARSLGHTWHMLPRPLKTAALLAGSAAVGIGARAVLHQPEYEGEGVAQRDTPFEASYSYRDRLALMNGTGDIVLGLHAQRH